jgi:branched-chain amino acid transport system ATP-binding protein
MGILEVKNLTKKFGGLTAVNDVSINVEQGSISAIIGPNGAGKTTLFNLLTGIYRPDSGSISFEGRSIIGLRPDQVNGAGMSRTFQSIRLFPGMTVVENVMVGMHSRLRVSLFQTITHLGGFGSQEKRVRDKTIELLEFVGLSDKGDEVSRNLPYGDQRRVEIARALASDPKLVLLDEPTAGMNPNESVDAMTLFRRVRDERGVTVVLIEHDMRVVMGISEKISVLDYGQKIAEGDPVEIRTNSRVVEAYLGRRATAEMEAIHGEKQS